MPRINRPNFKAKLQTPKGSGVGYVYWVGYLSGKKYKVWMEGVKVHVSDWAADARGQGNGRILKGWKANKEMDAFELRLNETWDRHPNLTPKRFNEVFAAKKPVEQCLPLSNWMADFCMDEKMAMPRLDDLGDYQKKVLVAFIKKMQGDNPLKRAALYNGMKPISFMDFLRGHVAETTVAGYEPFLKHLLAFEKMDGPISFDGIDWEWHKRFVNFLYSEQETLIDWKGESAPYQKKEFEQNTVANQLSMLRRVMNLAVKAKVSGNEIQREDGFVVSWVQGNGCPLYIEDMQRLEGADFSGSPKLANARLLAIRNYCTGVRYSDLAKIGPENMVGDSAIEIMPQKTIKRGIRVGIPLLPILKNIIHIPVKVPGPDGLRAHYREMLTVAGIDRPLVFSRYGADGLAHYDTCLTEKFSLHDLRRSFATMMVYVLNVDQKRVKMITGHTTDASFEKYLFPSAEYLSAKSLTEEWQAERRRYLLGVG